MSEAADDRVQGIRAQAAAEERAAILEIVERYARLLSHGHGATGAQVVQQILEEIYRREHPGSAGAQGGS
ncbi:MAG TPA: hypothetical protein VHG51_17050 [Longimicrobiaceae bacterium]|nr:hypothetical protein [Longimicrobiaceae bacterium]